MRREEKFIDTKVFHFYNANPKNKFTDDCVIRAIATAENKSWDEIFIALVNIALKYKVVPTDTKCYSRYLENLGWIKCKQPRKSNNTKFTGKEFCNLQQEYKNTGILESQGIHIRDSIIAHVGGHHIVAIKDGIINDIWDSSEGCIGNYWIK